MSTTQPSPNQATPSSPAHANSMVQMAFGNGSASHSSRAVAMETDLFRRGVLEHAICLGIDPAVDSGLLWIAEQSLVAPLPPGWVQLTSPTGEVYYHDETSSTSTWEHPCDEHYRQLFRSKKADGDACTKPFELSASAAPCEPKSADWRHVVSCLENVMKGMQLHDENADPGNQRLTEPDFTTEDLAKMMAEIDGILGPFRGALCCKRAPEETATDLETRLLEQVKAFQQEAEESAKEWQCREELLVKELEDVRNLSSQADIALKDRISETETKLQDAISSKVALEKEVQGLTTELEDERNLASQADTALKDRISETETKLQDAISSKETMEKEVKGLTTELEDERNLASQADTIAADEEKFNDQAQEKLDAVKKCSLELESTNRELQLQLSASQEKEQEFAEQLLALQKASATAESDKAARAFEVQQLKSKIADQNIDIERLSDNSCRAQGETRAQVELLEETRKQLVEEKEGANALRQQQQDQTSELNALESKTKSLSDKVTLLRNELEHAKKSLEETSGCREAALKAQTEANTRLQQINAWEDKFREEQLRSKALNDKIIDLQGNIRVFCRIRPLSKSEQTEYGVELRRCIQYIDDGKLSFHGTEYEFDRVFAPGAIQGCVFSEVASAVASSMDGHKVCIFAFGQTGSGKTYTMDGPKDDRGVNARALAELFDLAKSSSDVEYSFTVSVVEVYNDAVFDLLVRQPKSGRGNGLEIHMRKEEVHIDGITERIVTNSSDVEILLDLASKHRVTESNNINESSSRSHLVLSIKVSGKNLSTGLKTRGKLSLIDLAGSERLKNTSVSGQRLKEAKSINSSLSALGDVIAALGSRKLKQHVPYRNSKLTFLLQDSLRSNARVLMFVNINPSMESVGESKCSLKFASRCRAIRLGKAQRQKVRDEDL